MRVESGDGVLSIMGLGSCVAVVLHDGTPPVGGLAHILLPDPSVSTAPEKRNRFATTAIPDLVDELEAAGADRARITARLVGGASMFQDLLPANRAHMGERNVEAARATLEGLGIPIINEDVGGTAGRSLHFDVADGRLQVSSARGEYALV